MIDDFNLKRVEAEMDRLREFICQYRGNKPENNWTASRYRAAVRRASVDLTRALADLRKPRR